MQFALLTASLLIAQVNPSLLLESVPRLPASPPALSGPSSIPEPVPIEQIPSSESSPSDIPEFEQTIVVNRFQFSGNTVISTEALEAVVAPFIGQPLTFADLIAARIAVTNLYLEQGYTTSGAYIPVTGNEQIDPDQAVIVIQVIEGQVETLDIRGDSRLHAYVRHQLRSVTRSVLNQSELEDVLRRLQIDPRIASISATLSTGSAPNLSILTVEVDATPIATVTARVDNERSPVVGEFQQTGEIRLTNSTGLGEILDFSYSRTNGSNSYEVRGEIPFNPSNGTIEIEFVDLDAQIIEEPFDQFDIASNAQLYQLSIRQPLTRLTETGVKEWAFGVTLAHVDSQTTLEDQPFSLSIGANQDGETRISAIRLFQEYTRQDSQAVFLARSQLSIGVNLLDAATNNGLPDSRFVAWQGQIGWLRQVFGDSRLLIRGEMQFSGDSLLPLEQFSLGGPLSVRGYRQDAIISDNALFGSVELQVPVLNTRTDRLDIVPFTSFGTAWNNSQNPDIEDSTIGSVGLGIQFQLSDNLFVRGNYAIPLTKIDTGDDSLQQEGFDFAAEYRFRF